VGTDWQGKIKMSYDFIKLEDRGAVAMLTLNRPEVMNALNLDIVLELQDALGLLPSNKEIKVVLFQGAGGNFCSGADRTLFLEEHSSPEWLDGMRHFARVVRMLREIPQPIVTKLRGVAVGAGSNLALAGDFVVASHDARLRENFVHIGAILDSGGTYFLPRLVGLVKARELAFLGDEINGKKAASLGLIYRSVPDENLDKESEILAKKLALKPLAAMALIKEGLDESFNRTLKEILEWEAAHQAIMLRTKEHKEIVQFLKGMKES
jgi:2-(1,2-epoxy-1,2-dihydrophenyl)acetyl-CoA isomerase